MSNEQTDNYGKFVKESKECILNPLFFKWKDSVETSAKEIYKFFQDNPKADYVAFYEYIRDFSNVPGNDNSKSTYVLVEEILEYSGLIPSVRANLCQKIIDVSFGGVGSRVAAKILDIPERLVVNVKRWYSKENLKLLYDDFADKYLNGSPKNIDELIAALIRCRKDFNKAYASKMASSFPDESTIQNGRKKLVKKKQVRIHALKNGVFN